MIIGTTKFISGWYYRRISYYEEVLSEKILTYIIALFAIILLGFSSKQRAACSIQNPCCVSRK